MTIKVGLIDYGAGNFSSVWSAFEKHNCQLHVINEPQEFRGCTHLVLPGVGAFSSTMEKLHKLALFHPIQEILSNGRTPFLGICVGMQILAECGAEFCKTTGFGVVTGSVEKFDFSSSEPAQPLPHMGWNDVKSSPNSRLFCNIDSEDPSFYFVHSYRLQSNDVSAIFSHADYGEEFIAAFEKGNIFGVQFHPEKSQRNGHQLIANFLNVEPC